MHGGPEREQILMEKQNHEEINSVLLRVSAAKDIQQCDHVTGSGSTQQRAEEASGGRGP